MQSQRLKCMVRVEKTQVIGSKDANHGVPSMTSIMSSSVEMYASMMKTSYPSRMGRSRQSPPMRTVDLSPMVMPLSMLF